MEEKGVNRQTGKWQYQDYSERYEKAGEMTFRELADWYFDHYAQHRLKASTVYNYRYSVERFMLPELGEIPLKHFNNLMLTDWFAHLTVSPEYCRNLFITMRSIFSEAVRAGLVERHPCDYVVLPQKKKTAEEKEPLLTEAQVRELYDMCRKDYWLHYVVRFLLLTGVRSGDGVHHQDREVHGPQLCGADIQDDDQGHGLPGHHPAQSSPCLCHLHAGAGRGPEGGFIATRAQFDFHDGEPVHGCSGPLPGGGSGEAGTGVVWKGS